MNELDRLKNKIRQCDAAVLEALLERNKGIAELTLYKKEHGAYFFITPMLFFYLIITFSDFMVFPKTLPSDYASSFFEFPSNT